MGEAPKEAAEAAALTEEALAKHTEELAPADSQPAPAVEDDARLILKSNVSSFNFWRFFSFQHVSA